MKLYFKKLVHKEKNKNKKAFNRRTSPTMTANLTAIILVTGIKIKIKNLINCF